MRHKLFTGLGILVALLVFSVPTAAAVASPSKVAATPPSASTARASKGIFAFILPSALSVDIAHETVTLPLYEGRTSAGATTWYIVTESSSLADATKRGVSYSPKLLNAVGTAAVQNGHLEHGTLVFDGTVNFGLHWSVVPGPTGFPPKSFSYGARGDAQYSPVVQIDKGVVINAPQVANKTGLSGSVVAIDYGKRTVTLSLLAGWVDGQFTLYLHTDASLDLVAALEHSTYAPNLKAAPGFASDDPTSSRAAIIPVVNGILGDSDPQRQGLESALLGQGDPLNVAQEQPSDSVHYSPLWDVTPVMWTDAAIAAGKRVQLHSQDDVIAEATAGNIVGALGTTPNAGLGGITAPNAISNCPIIVVFPG